MSQYPIARLRRMRQHPGIRQLVRETSLHVDKLVLPLFIRSGIDIKTPIKSMPGHYQFSLDRLSDEIKSIVNLGITSIILFGIPKEKDPLGKDAYSDNGIIQQAIPIIKAIAPSLVVISDICFCEYTDHGHCGFVQTSDKTQDFQVDNDKTLALLALQAVSHARAGADILAPSGCMDGMVKIIREALDQEGFVNKPILSYSAKYASHLYSPFREAALGPPQFGDRRTYQIDFANSNEVLRESALDISEGADMLMVKPAHTYLDIIYKIKQSYPEMPLCAYHTSGEYAMLKAAAANGWIDEEACVHEIITAIKRAGADFIITYFAKDLAKSL